ncbi:hypothetical protein U1Q18_036388 [Sarracenia purpurea var. burkii]
MVVASDGKNVEFQGPKEDVEEGGSVNELEEDFSKVDEDIEGEDVALKLPADGDEHGVKSFPLDLISSSAPFSFGNACKIDVGIEKVDVPLGDDNPIGYKLEQCASGERADSAHHMFDTMPKLVAFNEEEFASNGKAAVLTLEEEDNESEDATLDGDVNILGGT